ncbi:MAG: hypothetical protein HKN31_13225 [Pricia sp.]|nr:hypothetical protein [Pricia sp.]
MGFTISYQRFFTVRVKEESTDNAVRSLKFIPSSTCENLLNNYQLVFKPMEDGFDVYYKSFPEASTPIPAPIASKVKFTFGIQIMDASFTTKYEPETVDIPQYYLDNLKSDGGLSPGQNLTASTRLDVADLTYIKQQTFTQKTKLPIGDEPSEWRIKEKFGTATLQTVPITVPTDPNMPFTNVRINDPDAQVIEYIKEEGPYILETDKPDPTPFTVYLSNPIKQGAFNGVLDIYWNSIQSNVPVDTGRAYQIIVKLK